jgi:hypothetical protein
MRRLPLTLFETYLFHEDRPAYPCWILTRYRFRGSFQREVLRQAWVKVNLRHPLLAAVVRRDWLGRLYWESAADYHPIIEWDPPTQETGWPAWKAIDLERAPGVHLLAVERDGFSELFLQVHHSVHDGAGTFAVVDDLLVHYARELGSGVEPARLRPDRLPGRNGFGLSPWDKLRMAPSQAVGLAASLQLHLTKVAAILPASPVPDGDPAPAGMPALASRRLSGEAFRGLRDAAKRLGAGVHDLFIRDAQAALGVWLKVHGSAGPLEWTRLALPVNLRRPADIELPAANLVGLVGIDRRVRSLARRERLLFRAREDLGWVKKRRFGYVFLTVLWLQGLLPGGIRRYARRRKCRATLLLTNLGQILSGSPLLGPDGRVAVPGAVLEDVCLQAPVRPGTSACLAVGVYAHALAADLTYDPRVLTPAQADALVQAFADQLRLTIDTPSG